MASAKLKGSTYTYYVTLPADLIISDENYMQYFGKLYVPVITRNKTGKAFTRYFKFWLVSTKTDSQFLIATYAAAFTASAKTATISLKGTGVDYMGTVANEIAATFADGINYQLTVEASTTEMGDIFAGAGTSVYASFVFTPNITLDITKTSTIDAVFGYVKGYHSAVIQVRPQTTWSDTDTGVSVSIPITSMTVSCNGVNGQNYIETGTITSNDIMCQATAVSVLECEAALAQEITCQDYTKPYVSKLKASRLDGDDTKATISFDYTLDALNKSSEAATQITKGAITAYYVVSQNGATVISGNVPICADGSALSNLTGSLSTQISGLDTELAYKVSVYITDRISQGPTVAGTLATAFYLFDFNASGVGIGIGCASPTNGLKIGSTFYSGIIDVVYPVGSYYETSDGSLDPNTRFGGTWELISGRFSMPADSISNGKPSTTTPTYGGSATGGEASVTLTNNEIPAHNHGESSLVGAMWNIASQSKSVKLSASGICTVGKEEGHGYATENQTTVDGITIDASHTHDVVGGGGAHNNMPPWIAVYKWHRTA